jgi:hypothetical protein
MTTNRPEKQREYCRRWRAKNPDYQKKWQARNPGKQAEYDHRDRLKHPQEHLKRVASWRKQNPDKAFGFDLKKYGLTVERFHEMIIAQSGRCAICGEAFTYAQRGLNVDHDHDTGRVRGLLCARCNIGLGAFKDRPEILEAALLYLRLA